MFIEALCRCLADQCACSYHYLLSVAGFFRRQPILLLLDGLQFQIRPQFALKILLALS